MEKSINLPCGRHYVTLVVMIGHSNKLYQSISDYYIENAKVLAGGKNIVNVILVDFRGLDTMGEISVIAMASIGVFILVSLVIRQKTKGVEYDVWQEENK